MPKLKALKWTGDNINELEEFALQSAFGFTVGSNYYQYRWYHRLVNKILKEAWMTGLTRLRTWVPKDDPKVLEIYPDNPEDTFSFGIWTTARPGDMIFEDGYVRRDSEV